MAAEEPVAEGELPESEKSAAVARRRAARRTMRGSRIGIYRADPARCDKRQMRLMLAGGAVLFLLIVAGVVFSMNRGDKPAVRGPLSKRSLPVVAAGPATSGSAADGRAQ